MSAEHDPLCLSLRLEWRTPEPENCDVCAALTAARADEREKAARRVEALAYWTHSNGAVCDIDRREALAAIRGQLDTPDADAGEGIDDGGES